MLAPNRPGFLKQEALAIYNSSVIQRCIHRQLLISDAGEPTFRLDLMLQDQIDVIKDISWKFLSCCPFCRKGRFSFIGERLISFVVAKSKPFL